VPGADAAGLRTEGPVVRRVVVGVREHSARLHRAQSRLKCG
jgi:hypothetical protein